MIISSDKLRTPQFIFIIYVVIAAIFIMIFKFIFPGSDEPLSIYSFNWRVVQGLLEVFNLFPALALSALVIPFGLASFEENYQSFSELFFKRLSVSVITAIGAAIVYAIIFFLFFPMVKNYEENMRYSGDLYRLAKANALERRNAGDWYEASQFLSICDYIWFQSKDLQSLQDEVAINLERKIAEENRERAQARAVLNSGRRNNDIWPLSTENRPVDATQAIAMSREAFIRERYFDSHWLANLGSRLAQNGSVEEGIANRIANEAWDMISSQAPNQREAYLYNLYNIKLYGYKAMEAGDWIRAYYTFLELLSYTPDDPDVKNYLAASEAGAKEIAFFIDEMEMAMGVILNNAVFSLPGKEGRIVMRFSSLTKTDDIAYGIGFEYMDFDEYMNPKSIVTARYTKLVPVILDEPKIIILTHALDRYNNENSFHSEWLLGEPIIGGILLDICFDELSLITNARRGLTNLLIGELFSAADNLGDSGYIPQVFHAEILNRLGSALFFLPVSILIIVTAWRYRARKRPRYIFFLFLPILPIIFNGFVFIYRSIINTSAIWLVLSIGFPAALTVFIVFLAVSLFVSLIVLAAQHT